MSVFNRFKFLRKKILLAYQIVLLYSFDLLFKAYFSIRKNKTKFLHRTFTIGVDEIAKNVYNLKRTLEDAYSVSLRAHQYYDLDYDFTLSKYRKWELVSPVLLAYLSNVTDVFIYIWYTGYLADRAYDFSFLKNKGVKIVAIFAGDDIRSIKQCRQYYAARDMDCHCNYYGSMNPVFDTEDYEREKMRIMEVAERYCDVIFGARYGQFPYSKREMHPFIYMIDIDGFHVESNKFKDMDNITILHAPSSPIIKGTPLVRAAIKKLKTEGYRFEYIELINISNSEVRALLLKSHIVLNQFYAVNPGLFGIEAMASGTAVLMSADPDSNPDIPPEGKDAWIITPYWEIYDKLKMLLDNTELIEDYAVRGRVFVEDNYTFKKAREKFHEIFLKERILG